MRLGYYKLQQSIQKSQGRKNMFARELSQKGSGRFTRTQGKKGLLQNCQRRFVQIPDSERICFLQLLYQKQNNYTWRTEHSQVLHISRYYNNWPGFSPHAKRKPYGENSKILPFPVV